MPDGKLVLTGLYLFSVARQIDDKLPRPVPLKFVEDRGAYRLYAGREWVSVKPE